MCFAVTITNASSHANEQEEVQERAPIRSSVNDRVIRLESTIRGDQQQPRILSIVPWDSPANRRISRVALTGEIGETMTPIHRHAFLQRIQLHEQLNAALSENKDK
jgi:hypothetical protein